MATTNTDDNAEDQQTNSTRASTGSSRDEHGFTEEWVRTHASRATQRQLEVHDVPSGTPRTQLHQEEEERNVVYDCTNSLIHSDIFRWRKVGAW